MAGQRKTKRSSAHPAGATSDSSNYLRTSSRGSSGRTGGHRSVSSSVSTRHASSNPSVGSFVTETSDDTRDTRESSGAPSYHKRSTRHPESKSSGIPGSPHHLWKKFNMYSLSTPGRLRRGHISLLQLFNWFMCAEEAEGGDGLWCRQLLDGRVLSPTHLSLVFNEARLRSLSLLQFDTLISLLCSRRLLKESVVRQRLEDAPKPKEAREMKCKLDSMMYYESAPPTPSTVTLDAEEGDEGQRRGSADAVKEAESSVSGETKSQEEDSVMEEEGKKRKKTKRKSGNSYSEETKKSKASKAGSKFERPDAKEIKKSKGASAIGETGKNKKAKRGSDDKGKHENVATKKSIKGNKSVRTE